MRRLDRYILAEITGPFLFGMGAFAVLMFSLDLLRNAFSLVFERGMPAGVVATSLVFQMPQLIALTLPMGALFGVLMAMGRLSGDGEVIAIQAGGVSFGRAVTPAILVGLVVSLLALTLNETVVPPASQASRRMLAEAPGGALSVKRHYLLQLPPEGEPVLQLYAGEFDLADLTLRQVWIIELDEGTIWQWYWAERARWVADSLVLEDVVHYTSDGLRTYSLERFSYRLGRSPQEAAGYTKDPNDMSMAEIRQEIAARERLDPRDPTIATLRGEYWTHTALPWAALGFALLAAPLGVRPHRTSRGMGMGISLAVILGYFIISSLMSVIGRQGAIHPALAAWLPNIVLFLTGIGLTVERSR